MPNQLDTILAPTTEGQLDPAVKETVKRGAGFTWIVDFMVSQCFILASKDSQKGTSQKGTTFHDAMEEAYKGIVEEQEQFDTRQNKSRDVVMLHDCRNG
jgi:hypothetical protein